MSLVTDNSDPEAGRYLPAEQQQLLRRISEPDAILQSQLSDHQVGTLIDSALLRDRHWLKREYASLKRFEKTYTPKTVSEQRWKRRLIASLETVALRRASSLSLDYPADLPISKHLEQLAQALNKHSVVIVAGETGSGKTTQLPKLCSELGRGIVGRIGHTQPRRLAARTVAARIAEECAVTLGEAVGYQFRFQTMLTPQTQIKLMTDGILLSEIASDRFLNEYDTLIIDEAHERSLNIDFLLGYLKNLLSKRSDLKVIVTSATIDVGRFATFFNNAPVIHIEGRSFPVRIEYIDIGDSNAERRDDLADKPQGDGGAKSRSMDHAEIDWLAAVQRALDAIELERDVSVQARDVLVFLSGEQQIRELSHYLRSAKDHYEVLPLYARLSQQEQQRIFSRSTSVGKRRRLVLSTNVAETSITVPGIGYVIDCGTARVSRYSERSKLQRLPIEAVSQASAAQRAGRCGRIAPGVCYRLYAEADFLTRPQFTEPEILRTNLAAVILQMQSMGLGAVEKFPFIEAPRLNQVRAGARSLQELGALDSVGKITADGKHLARLPLDPKLAKILLSAAQLQCIDDALIVVSALSVQDPREFPYEKRQAADQQHRRFWHADSDFLSWINLWYYLETLRGDLSRSKFRRRCEKEFLNYLRIQEWRNVHWQLKLAVRPLLKLVGKPSQTTAGASNQLKPNKAGLGGEQQRDHFPVLDDNDVHGIKRVYSALRYQHLHRAILSGIPLNVGSKEQRGEYRGTRSLRFFIFPGSAQFKASPAWLLAGEIVETKKIYARQVAKIDPLWIAQDLKHLVKQQYGEPYWHPRRGQVVAKQTTLFFGLTVASNQLVSYRAIDLPKSREVFIQQALVEQAIYADRKFQRVASFWSHNLALLDAVKQREEKLRRRDLLVADEVMFHWYASRLPEFVCSQVDLLKAIQQDASLNVRLQFSLSDISLEASEQAGNATLEQFPDRLEVGDWQCALHYAFTPGQQHDGVTARVPVEQLNVLPHAALEWLVPGMLRDKCVDMLKLLPKSQRKRIVPIPDAATKLLAAIDCTVEQQHNRSLFTVLAEQLRFVYQLQVDVSAWRAQCEQQLDPYHVMRIEVIGDKSLVLEAGRNTLDVQSASQSHVEHKVEAVAQHGFRREHIVEWDFGELALDRVEQLKGLSITGYPTLIDAGDSVTLDLTASASEALAKTQTGLVRLAMLSMKDKVRFLKRNLCKEKLRLFALTQRIDRDRLIEQLIQAAVASACFDTFEAPPRDKTAFDNALAAGRGQVIEKANLLDEAVLVVSECLQTIAGLLEKKRPHFTSSCDDIDQQLQRLVGEQFLSDAGFERAQHYPRYFQAIVVRLERMSVANVKAEQEYCKKLASLDQRLKKLLYNYPHAIKVDQQISAYRWIIEELRVSLFAQQLKTAIPVSFARVEKAWQQIDSALYPLLER